MKQGAKLLLSLAGILTLTASAHAATHAAPAPVIPTERQVNVMDNPYNPIVERNIFDLHDPPPPPAAAPTNAPPPNIHLTGITTILGKKKAYFMVQSAPVPGKPASPDRYMTLIEGQRQEMLEVLEIDPKAKLVKISNSGNVSTITFETNKLAFNGAPATGAPGGGVPRIGGLAPPQPGNNYYPNSPSAVPPRPLRPTNGADTNPYGGGGNQFGGYQANASGAIGGYQGNVGSGYGNPAYANTGYGNTSVQTAAATPQPMDAEQQIVLMELQREATKSAVANGMMPPLPPTPLSQAIELEQQQQQQQNGGAPAPSLPNFPGSHNTIK